MANRRGKSGTVTDFIFLGSKITADGDSSQEIKTLAPWKKSYDKPRQCIKKQRHHFAAQSPYSQSYGFSSGRVQVWEWAMKKSERWKIVAVQSLSQVWLFVTPWAAACQASLSFTLSWSLLKLMSIDAIQSSYPLSSTSPPAFNLSQHQSLFQWVSSSHQVAKVLLWQYFGIVLQIQCSPSTNCIANTCIPNTHWKRPWCWEKLKAKGEESGRGWDV